MRKLVVLLAVTLAVPAGAQTRIDASGIHAPGVSIDSHGIRRGGARVDAAGVRAGDGRVIRTNGNTRAVDCGGGALTLDGNANRFAVAHCSPVTINGNDNVLDVALRSGDELATLGNRNAVNWHAPRGARVAVNTLGNRNRISRR